MHSDQGYKYSLSSYKWTQQLYKKQTTRIGYLNSSLRLFSFCVKSVSSDCKGITETPRNLSCETCGSAAFNVFWICPLLPTIRTGRVVPLNLAIGTTRSAPTLICREVALKHWQSCIIRNNRHAIADTICTVLCNLASTRVLP